MGAVDALRPMNVVLSNGKMYVDNRGPSGCQLVIAAVIAIGAVVAYFGNTSFNAATGQKQHIDMTVDQEIALGLQAAPRMEAQYGGEDPDAAARHYVSEIGKAVVARSEAANSDYKFQFHDLADDQTINAFALPGGQIFITRGLLTKLTSSAQLAAVLGHECGHVIARHSAQQLARARLSQGLTGAAVVATYDPHDYRSRGSAAVATLVGQLVSLKFSRKDELEADKLGIRLMSEAGYDPRAMIEVMEILKQADKGGREPEFFSTHPSPDNREDEIRREIAGRFPRGVPSGLTR